MGTKNADKAKNERRRDAGQPCRLCGSMNDLTHYTMTGKLRGGHTAGPAATPARSAS